MNFGSNLRLIQLIKTVSVLFDQNILKIIHFLIEIIIYYKNYETTYNLDI